MSSDRFDMDFEEIYEQQIVPHTTSEQLELIDTFLDEADDDSKDYFFSAVLETNVLIAANECYIFENE